MYSYVFPTHTHSNHTGNREDNNSDFFTIRKQTEIPVIRSKNNPDKDSLGGRIKNAREKANYSISQLASLCKISFESLSRIENNRGKPSLPTLRKLSEVLNTPVSYLGCFEDLPENTLGQKIRKARCFRGLTKVQLAKEFGVDVKTISNWEKDNTQPLDIYRARIEQLLSTI